MIWSCEFTSSGWLVSWTGLLPTGGSVRFFAGADEDLLTDQFTSTSSPGYNTISLPGSEISHFNAVGRMDIYVDAVAYEVGRVLPLIPGMRVRDMLLLEKLAKDHRTTASRHGQIGRLFKTVREAAPCTRCTDPVTGARLTHKCTVCGGSGMLAGWFGPFEMQVLFMSHHQENVAPTGAGADVETRDDVVRLDAFPRPRENDRIFFPTAGLIYIVGTPSRTVAGVSGVPAVVELPVRIPQPGSPEAIIPDAFMTVPDPTMIFPDMGVGVVDGGEAESEYTGYVELDGGEA